MIFREIAKLDVEMAKLITLQPWLADDVTAYELYGMVYLLRIAQQDLEMAKLILDQPFMAPPFRHRDAFGLEGLANLVSQSPERNVMETVAAQPWFRDGLDDLEIALLALMGSYIDDNFRRALIETHYIASLPAKLPLTGDVEFIVIRHTPFPPDDETLVAMEESAGAIEEFTDTLFPLNDVILLVVEPDIWPRVSGSVIGGSSPEDGYYARYILVNDPRVFGDTDRYKGVIYHELGHLYHLSGPRWLVEGTAEFLRSYTRSRIGVESIDQRLAYLQSHESHASCDKENLQQHLNDWRPNYCDYYLGELFLLGMYTTIGADGVSAALRDLQTLTILYRSGANADLIYQVFEKHTPPGLEDAFKAAYRLYHGGPIITLPPASPNRQALLTKLYEAARGADWTHNANWLSDAPLGTWYGVITDAGDRVTGLVLTYNDLIGQIPSELGGLANLKELNLSGNNLSGEIPSELGGLTNLRELSLENNDLVGEMPPELGNLSNLETLNLGDNDLSGEIPSTLASLASLEAMYLYGNQLNGEIPSELARLQSLLGLHLRDNQLSGEIPSALGNLVGLRRLNLGGNELSGEIPPELGDLINLTVSFDLSRNHLIGGIPPALGKLTTVSRFDLSENQLTGEIPSELGGLANVRGLYLSDNQLTGEIPSELGNLGELSALNLSNNQLTGGIPRELGLGNPTSSFWRLHLSGNHLTGQIPPELGNLIGLMELDLSNNQLTGSIPPALEGLSHLRELRLGGNMLTGCIPAGLRDVPDNDFSTLGLPFCDAASS